MKSNKRKLLIGLWVTGLLSITWQAEASLSMPPRVSSWDPPPKEFMVTPLPKPTSGSRPSLEWELPNVCHRYFLHSNIIGMHLYPADENKYPCVLGGKEQSDSLNAKLLERSNLKKYIHAACMNGYSANYPISENKANILPILGHLFYVPAAHKSKSSDLEKEYKIIHLDTSHSAYKKLSFLQEGTYSFPCDDSIAKRHKEIYGHKDKKYPIPIGSLHSLRGHQIAIRKIENRKDKKGKLVPQVELAILPAFKKTTEEQDFRWYSVDDELPIPWAFLVRSSSDDILYSGSVTADLKYYKIVNIIPRDSKIIKVQLKENEPPVECTPIGWIDIDIHGRSEKESKPSPKKK